MKTLSIHPTVALHILLGGTAIFAVCGMASVASAQATTNHTIRVVCYNLMADIDGFTTPLAGLIAPYGGGGFTETSSGTVTNGGVLEGIGEENVGPDPAQPIDILALEETTSNPTTVQPIVNALNTFYSLSNPGASNMYAMSAYQATEEEGLVTNGNGPNAMVYNTTTVQLVASVPVDPPGGTNQLGSTSGEYREVMRYEFAAAGVTVTPSNVFYVYVSHYKAQTNAVDQTDRAGEAAIIRNDEANHLPATARVIYLGDYNISTSGELSYQLILSNKAPNGIQQGQGLDLLNLSAATNIDWSTNSLLSVKSETATKLEWRFDIQIMTSNIYYGVPGGLAYVPGTYHIFGNNGTTPYLDSVDGGSDTALNSDLAPGSTISASQLYKDLTGASDHLPMVADYTIPVPVAPPTASFTATPTNGVAPLTVNFTDTSSNSPTSWAWTFGDTGTSTSRNPSHTYTTPGTYTVRLIASNGGGSGTNTAVNYITALTPPPTAGFMAVPTSGPAPLSVNFTDTSTGSVTGWAWAFGDGNVSISQNPTDIYVTPGTYTVQEIVSGLGGPGTDTVANLISVYDPFVWWQLNYFSCTNCPQAQAGADPYGKGINNTNQFLLGLNPTNPASVFQIDSLVTQGSNSRDVLVTWTTVGGITNVVQATAGTVDGSGSYATNFFDLSPQVIIQGTSGQITNYLDASGATNSPARYYRIRFQQ